MTKTLYFDTALNDRWVFGRGERIPDEEQPHLVRLAFILEGGGFRRIADACHMTRLPPGQRMSPGATKANGIMDADLLNSGMTLSSVITEFAMALGKADLVVAHNIAHHKRVITRSIAYLGWPERVWPPLGCAMIGAKDIVKIERKAPGGGFLFPSFDACYERFVGPAPLPSGEPVMDGFKRVEAVRLFWSNIRRQQALNQPLEPDDPAAA
jgi:hypothetical protein